MRDEPDLDLQAAIVRQEGDSQTGGFAVHISLAHRLASFDPDQTLVADAAAIGKIIAGHELAASRAFMVQYLKATPVERRPSDSELTRFQQCNAVAIQAQLAQLDHQRWADEIQRYWVLTIGDIDALTNVRAALASQYGFIANQIAACTTLDAEASQRLLSAVLRIAYLEDCILGNHFSETTRLIARDREQQAAAFRVCIEDGVSHAADLGEELRYRAGDSAAATNRMLERTSEIAAAAKQSASDMREAALTATGLAQAISMARSEVEVASDIAARASRQLDDAVRISKALAESASTVDGILKLIREIAGQTKLLSLNATIEASRAGETGRGFAVVAQEIKGLATQSAQATEEISRKIATMRSATEATVEVNSKIRDTVAKVHSSAHRLHEAIGAQSATASTIIAAVEGTALAAENMARVIATIRTDTENVAGEIGALEDAFERVNGTLAELREAATSYVAVVD